MPRVTPQSTSTFEPLWKCYGITTADRPDRERRLRAELARTGLPFEVLVSTRPTDAGGFASVGVNGCFLSHLRALRRAQEDGVDVAVLVEDDAIIVGRFPDLLGDIADELASDDWSIVLLGYLGSQSPSKFHRLSMVSEHVARASHWELTGTHFFAVRNSALEALIENFEERLRPGGHRIPADGVLNEFRRDTGAPTLLCLPNLSRQDPSRSGIAEARGIRTRLLDHELVYRAVHTFRRRLWDVESVIPPRMAAWAWNARARLSSRWSGHATSS